MQKSLSRTSERLIPDHINSDGEALMYFLHLFSYEFALTLIPANSCVLDIGSGEGYGTAKLAEIAGTVAGLDVDSKTVEHARKKYASENCSFSVYDGVKLPYEDCHFEAIVSFQVIEHIKDDHAFLSEIRRVLKKNGVFVLTTPNRNLRLKPNQKPWNRFHVREYGPEEFRRLLENAFREVSLCGVTANEEIRNFEIRRAKLAQKVSSFDPFGVRRLIPIRLRQILGEILRSDTSIQDTVARNKNWLDKYSTENFHVTEDAIEHSLHLFGICRP